MDVPFQAPDVPKHIGKYEVVCELSRSFVDAIYGARDLLGDPDAHEFPTSRDVMNITYHGRHSRTGRAVQIKTITGNLADNRDLLDRFYREARAAGGLQHPNIISVLDVGEDNGTPFIVYEMLVGSNLAEVVEREEGGRIPLPISLKLNYMIQVCRGLEFAHKRGVVLRGLKPENIFITTDGTAKLTCFTYARLAILSSTTSGILIGTAGYMSPEAIRGEKVDGRADIWAVGGTMYEIFAYTKPFEGKNITALIFAIVAQEPKGPRELRPELPAELENIIRRALKKNPAERYPSAAEMLKDLEKIYGQMREEG